MEKGGLGPPGVSQGPPETEKIKMSLRILRSKNVFPFLYYRGTSHSHLVRWEMRS